VDIGDRRLTEMRRYPLEQLVDIVECVADDRIVQRAEIRRQAIRINSAGSAVGKPAAWKRMLWRLWKILRWRPSQSIASRRSNQIEIVDQHLPQQCCSSFIFVVFVFACSRVDPIGENGMRVVEDA
jgi:hypothetical protein